MEDNSIEVIENTIIRIKRKFQEGIPTEKKLKYLQQLSQLPIKLGILKTMLKSILFAACVIIKFPQSTGIGKLVNKLRQEESPISDKAERLVAKWKKLASSEKTKSPEKAFSRIIDSEQPSSSRDDDGIDGSFSGRSNVSFGDIMMMPINDGNKKKKKKRKENDLLKIPLPSKIDLPDLSNFTPDTVYKPNRTFPEHAKSDHKITNTSHELTDITSKKTRSHMYTGKRLTSNGVVSTLYQNCMKVLLENIECLYETGGVPYVILEPLLSKCTPSQLQRLEYYNEYLVEDSDILWKGHCQNEFKGTSVRKHDDESWRDAFERFSTEREERLRRLSSKIKGAQAAKEPERSVKLAYVAGAPKGSVQSMRKQRQYGTGDQVLKEKRKELRDRIDKDQRNSAEVAIPFAKIPRRDRCSVRPPSSLSSTSRHPSAPIRKPKNDFSSQGPSRLTPSAVKKPTKKPMMAAAMKLMKSQKGRVNSQIIRR